MLKPITLNDIVLNDMILNNITLGEIPSDIPFLSEFPNSSAAYSLRKLATSPTDVVRVRRDSDNSEKNFTELEVKNDTMKNWVNQQIIPPFDVRELTSTGRDGALIPASLGLSLRNLSDTYTGDVVDVRRSSDDAEQGFTANEVADGTMVDFTNEDVVVYSSDYSSGTDSWLFSGGSFLTPQSIGGEDNALKVTLSADGFFFPQKTGGLVSGETYSISLKLYVPSDNTNSNLNFNVRESGGGTVLDCNLTEANVWQSFTVSLTSSTTQVLQVTSDISMTSGDVFYIKDFVVTQTSNSSGFVTKWHDQSAEANHATQTNPDYQPKIVENGVYLGEIVTDGVDDHFNLTNTIYMKSGTGVFAAYKDLGGQRFNLVSSGVVGLGWRSPQASDVSVGLILLGGQQENTVVSSSNDKTQLNLFSFLWSEDSTNASFGINGEYATKVFGGSVAISDTPQPLDTIGIHLGSATGSLKIKELIIYPTDQSANRTAFEANIGEYYGIAGIPAYDDTVNGYASIWYDQTVPTSKQRMFFDGVDNSVLCGTEILFDDDNWAIEVELVSTSGTYGMVAGGTGLGSSRWCMNLTNAAVSARDSISGTIYNVGFDSTLINGVNYTLKIERSGTTLRAYVNGILQSNTRTIPAISTYGFDEIGSRTNGVSNLFNGSISDVKVYDSDLTTVLHHWKGYGVNNENWTDQVGTNNATVNGSPERCLSDLSVIAHDAVQETAASQPQLVVDGEVNLSDLGLPALYFDANNERYFEFTSSVSNKSGFYTVSAEVDLTSVNKLHALIGGPFQTNTSYIFIIPDVSSFNYAISVDGSISDTGSWSMNGVFQGNGTNLGTYGDIGNLQTTLHTIVYDAGDPSIDAEFIGAFKNATGTTPAASLTGNYSELILFDTDKSTDQDDIETNINKYYSLY